MSKAGSHNFLQRTYNTLKEMAAVS